MEKVLDFYQLLKLGKEATNDQIRKAYLKQAKRTHPDRNPTNKTDSKFVKIHRAYKVLSNPRSKWIYDNILLPIFQINQSYLCFEEFLKSCEVTSESSEDFSVKDYSRKTCQADSLEEGLRLLDDPQCKCSRCSARGKRLRASHTRKRAKFNL